MKPVDHLTDDEFSQRVQQAVRALPDPPAALVSAAMALWPGAQQPWAQALQAAARHMLAVLNFDSWATPGLALGMRSARSPLRHLLFSAQGRDIDLRIAAQAESYSLFGQVLGPDEAGRIELRHSAEGPALHQVELDELGEFRIDDLSAGDYQLSLHLGADHILLPSLQVGEPTG